MFGERKHLVQFIFVLTGFIFIVRLFFLQVIESSYTSEAQNNIMRRITEFPYRGLISDRNGKLLVQNTAVFDLMIVPKEVQIKDTMALCSILNIEKEELIEKIKAARKYSYS